jgi:hypothetical protein
MMWRIFACIVLAVGTAAADPNPEAEQLFRDGRRLLSEGKPVEACEAFGASAKLEPSVGTYLNLGDCRAKLGQTASAWAAFAAAAGLAREHNDPRGAEAERRRAELEPKLSYLKIDAPRIPNLEIDRDRVATAPGEWGNEVPIDPAHYVFDAKAPGYEPISIAVDIAPGEHKVVAVPALKVHVIVAAPVEHHVLTPTRDIAIGLGGAGVLGLAIASGLALDANSLENKARAVCPSGQPCHDLNATQESKTAVSRGNIASAIGGVGLGAIAVGVALWFVGRPQETAAVARVVPVATPDSIALSFAGSF